MSTKQGSPEYSKVYSPKALPFTAPTACVFCGYVNSVNSYIDIYATFNNNKKIKVTNTNVYAHTGFFYPLKKGDIITFSGQVSTGNCSIIPLSA